VEPKSHEGAPTIATEFLADPELAREIEKRSEPWEPDPEGVLFRQGDLPTALYFVKSGEVALGMETDNRMVMCVRAGAGSLVGLPAVVGNKPYSMTAAPCAGAEISKIGSEEFKALIGSDPALALKALQTLAAEVRLARRCCINLIS